MTFEEYLAQFSGVEPSAEIIVETDEDMEAFKDMYRTKWADEHWQILEEWRKGQGAKEWQFANHDDECEDCNQCLNA